MKSFLRYAAVVLVALLLGSFVGNQFTQKKVSALALKQAQQQIKDAAKALQRAVELNEQLEATVARSDASVTQIQKVLAQRPALVPVIKEVSHVSDPNQSACPAYELSAGHVGLLNTARQGLSLDTFLGGDEAFATASGLGVEVLVDNDLEVVKLYHDLATRHDQLVDEVEEHLAHRH